MKRIKQLLAGVSVLGVLLGFAVAVPVSGPAYALTPQQEACQAIGSGKNCTTGTGTSLTSIVKLIVNVLSVLVGVVAVIMIIWGGLKYITSGGDANNVKTAKNTILYALIGLVIVALAQFIVRFVLTKTSSAVK